MCGPKYDDNKREPENSHGNKISINFQTIDAVTGTAAATAIFVFMLLSNCVIEILNVILNKPCTTFAERVFVSHFKVNRDDDDEEEKNVYRIEIVVFERAREGECWSE